MIALAPPRRHCRQLLFPPGLLALAWLLLLGCAALPQMRRMQQPQVILQLTMQPLKSCFDPAFTGSYNTAIRFSSSWLPCLSADKLEAFRSWQTVTFSGKIFADYFAYQQVLRASEAVKTDTTYRVGLRTHFAPGATYNSLVFSVDLLDKQGIKSWWLDMHHLPTTLYAFTNKPDTARFICGTDAYYIHLPEPGQPFDFSILLSPDWRYSTLLLLLIGLVSARRLMRQKQASQPFRL